jgi:hypothetical protein
MIEFFKHENEKALIGLKEAYKELEDAPDKGCLLTEVQDA